MVDACAADGGERLIGFDMWGTSTDVSHYAGRFELAGKGTLFHLLLRFYDCFDRFDYEGMAALFTDDGVWHRAGKTLSARGGMVRELSTRSTTQTIRHAVHNLIVRAQDAGRAEGGCSPPDTR